MPTEKTKAQLDDDILENVYTNANNEVTAAMLQGPLRDLNESAVNKVTDADKLVAKGGTVFTNADVTDGNYEYAHNSGTPYPASVTIWRPDGTTVAVPWRPKDGTSSTTLVVMFGGAIAAGNWTIKHIA